MERFYTKTPEGTRDRLFAECRTRRAAQSKLTSLFKKRGFSEVETPVVEYYDLFAGSGRPLPQESMLKIIDRSGKILVMRPDCTTPIARVAATRLSGGEFPQRLYYNQTIFRSDPAHEGRESELAQCGVELIGAPGLKGDIEVIALAVDALLACGLKDFHIELGHAGFFRALSEQLGTEGAGELRHCIKLKHYAALTDLLSAYGENPAARALGQIPLLFGDASILDEARALSDDSSALSAIDYLSEIYGELQAAGRGDYLRFDLGLVSGLEYYTGVVFRGYAQGAGRHVVAGGRYDNLVGQFGPARPGAGFAVYVDDLAACLPPTAVPRCETVIHYDPGMLEGAVSLLDAQPPGTAELSPCDALAESRSLAVKKGAKRLLAVTAVEIREETYV